MIASFTQFMLFVQLVSIALLSVWIVSMGLTETLSAIVISTVLTSLPRAYIIINNFFTAAVFDVTRADGKKFSRWQLLILMLQEFYWSSVCWYWSFPFAGFNFRPSTQHSGLPVLLIHGYGCNSGYWISVSRLLQKQNITHSAIDCEPALAGIDDYAVLIHNAITTLCQQTGQSQVIVLGHSMGGLSARAYMQRYGEEKIAHLITLGTPHHGSKLAAAAWGINAYQMRWNDNQEANSWINTLNASSTPATCSKIVSIYSRHDNIVSPQHSSYLPHARNIEIDLVGHVALAFTKQSVNIVMQEIIAARENKLISENR
jgi:predicted alpha/beta hydrolase family esterase